MKTHTATVTGTPLTTNTHIHTGVFLFSLFIVSYRLSIMLSITHVVHTHVVHKKFSIDRTLFTLVLFHSSQHRLRCGRFLHEDDGYFLFVFCCFVCLCVCVFVCSFCPSVIVAMSSLPPPSAPPTSQPIHHRQPTPLRCGRFLHEDDGL